MKTDQHKKEPIYTGGVFNHVKVEWFDLPEGADLVDELNRYYDSKSASTQRIPPGN